MKDRLDKLLAANGLGSRRDAKRLMRAGGLTVNGVVCTDAALIVDPDTDVIHLDGQILLLKRDIYLMLNKPAGVITSTEDPDHDTVMDLLAEPWCNMKLFPVGRLDADTEGLLVLTNDGPLTHRLTSPKTGVDKTYYAELRDAVADEAFADYERRFREGVTFRDGYTCLPAVLERAAVPMPGREVATRPAADRIFLTIQEGKYHQVKKMFHAVGNEVAYLRRVSMGNLGLDPALVPGEYRELTAAEIDILRASEEPAANGGVEKI